MEFKDKLRKLRTEAGLSQEALADKVHISRSAIAKYENGNGKPSEETLKALAFYFGVETSELRSDDDLKENSKKKKAIKITSIVGSLTLVIGILITSLTWCVKIATSKNKVFERISLLNSDDSVPVIQDETIESKVYLVNTFLRFTISIHREVSKYTNLDFKSDVVNFESHEFARILYDDDSNEALYVVDFLKEGRFELFYNIENRRKSIKFICDDSSKKWDKYRMYMKDLYPWIKTVSRDDIISFRYEESNGSLGPHDFRDIYYTEEKNDLDEAYSFLDNIVIISNADKLIVPGAESKTITYFFQDCPSQTIKIFNTDCLQVDNFSTDQFLKVYKNCYVPKMYNEHRFGFNYCVSNILAVNLKDNTKSFISYFYDLEFIEWPSDISYEESEPLFTVEGYSSEDMYIYSVDRFSYSGIMYQIVSEQKFDNLFN